MNHALKLITPLFAQVDELRHFLIHEFANCARAEAHKENGERKHFDGGAEKQPSK